MRPREKLRGWQVALALISVTAVGVVLVGTLVLVDKLWPQSSYRYAVATFFGGLSVGMLLIGFVLARRSKRTQG